MIRSLIRLATLLTASALAVSACATPTPVTVEVTRQVEVTSVVEVTPAPAPTQALPAPRTLNVQAGGGQETDVIAAFLPSAITVRAGDTLVWKVGGDELHTVTFNPPPEALAPVAPVPGGGPADLMIPPQVGFPTRLPGSPVETFDGANFASSGIMSKQPSAPNAPPNDTFSLTFTKPGTYRFLCLLHPYMAGIVTVEPAAAQGLPEQTDLDAQAKAETDGLTAQVKAADDASKNSASTKLGKSGNSMWFVTAGFNVGNPSAASYSFGAKDLTVKAGDSVTWISNEFHTVTFNPKPPPPAFIIPKPQTAGPPLLTLNPQVFFPVVPGDTYDPAQFFNSGVLGPGLPFGQTFTLTFDKPGTYEYFCAVHVQLGMKGTITVTK